MGKTRKPRSTPYGERDIFPRKEPAHKTVVKRGTVFRKKKRIKKDNQVPYSKKKNPKI